MAAELKHFFDERRVRAIAADLRRVHRPFLERSFVSACLEGLDGLELTARAWRIADVLHAHLPLRFPAAADVLLATLGPELSSTEGNGLEPFRYLPHVFYVQKHGLNDFEPAMRAQYELTKRFSAESSIRPFLVKNPDRTLARLAEWTRDSNVHVRRLVSEGTRPRLPWAPRLPVFVADPAPVLALLQLLKDDPERYVQRSVANNLNDISKDHPDVAVATCRAWSKGATADRSWIIRHALRSLVKRGHRGSLALLGAGARPEVAIAAVRFSPKLVRLGGKLEFSFRLESSCDRPQQLLVDYAVHFVKANGARKPKVFKLKQLTLDPLGTCALRSAVSFARMTTRQHYAGRHSIDVLVNGVAHELGEFEVRR